MVNHGQALTCGNFTQFTFNYLLWFRVGGKQTWCTYAITLQLCPTNGPRMFQIHSWNWHPHLRSLNWKDLPKGQQPPLPIKHWWLVAFFLSLAWKIIAHCEPWTSPTLRAIQWMRFCIDIDPQKVHKYSGIAHFRGHRWKHRATPQRDAKECQLLKILKLGSSMRKKTHFQVSHWFLHGFTHHRQPPEMS